MAFPSSARERSASVLSLTSAPLHKMQQQQHPHHFAAGTQRVSFPGGAALNLNVNAAGTAFPAPPHRPRADSNVSAATLAQFNYATYMYYLSVAALLSQSQSPDAAARGSGHAHSGHMRVHSTASNTSLRSSMSLSSTTSSSPDSAWAPGSARDGVLTPDTCSDIASDDDGTSCPLNELPTSCADTPVEGHPPASLARESQAQRAQHAKLASLAAAATLRTRPTPPPVLPTPAAPPTAVAKPSIASFWSDDGLPLAARYDAASFHRLRSPFADKLWWECVTHEKPWAPLATPIAKSEMPAVPLRRLSGLRINTRGGGDAGGKRNSRRRPTRTASVSLAATPR